MSIFDAIKNSILEQFDTSLTVGGILMSLLTATIIAALVVFVYRQTFAGVVYSKNTALTIILLTLATSMIIRTINANLSLSLGMVGALSIVRFRTAIKDPVDTAFLFWAVTGGIMAGAGLYIISIVGSLGIAVIFYLAYMVSVKAKSEYLLVFNYSEENEEDIEKVLATYDKKKLKSKSLTSYGYEVSYQVSDEENLDSFMKALKNEGKAENVNLVSYNNDFGL